MADNYEYTVLKSKIECIQDEIKYRQEQARQIKKQMKEIESRGLILPD